MSFNTLFGFIWLNGWEQMTFMYQLAFNPEYTPQKPIPSKYDFLIISFFVSFFMMSWYIIMNILVAFVIDTYTAMEETFEAE